MIRFNSRAGLRVLVGLLILLAASLTFAQTVTGTISGTVKDSSGAVLAGSAG